MGWKIFSELVMVLRWQFGATRFLKFTADCSSSRLHSFENESKLIVWRCSFEPAKILTLLVRRFRNLTPGMYLIPLKNGFKPADKTSMDLKLVTKAQKELVIEDIYSRWCSRLWEIFDVRKCFVSLVYLKSDCSRCFSDFFGVKTGPVWMKFGLVW